MTGCRGENPCGHALFPFHRHCVVRECHNSIHGCEAHAEMFQHGWPKQVALKGVTNKEKFYRVKYRYKDPSLAKLAYKHGPVTWWTWTETTDEKKAIETRDEVNSGIAFLAIIATVERQTTEIEYTYPLGGTFDVDGEA